MKTSRIKLASWVSDDENLDIDWPQIQRLVGADHIEWLLKQPKNLCQLVVDKKESNHSLTVEIYDEKLLVEYHLIWAK